MRILERIIMIVALVGLLMLLRRASSSSSKRGKSDPSRHRISDNRAKGKSPANSVLVAGKVRLRAVALQELDKGLSALVATVSTGIKTNAHYVASESLMKTTNSLERHQILDIIARYSLKGVQFSLNERDGSGIFTCSLSHCQEVISNGTQPSTHSPKARIPLIVHHSWKNKDLGTHSDEAVDCRRRIRTSAPDFYYNLWTDDDISELIKRYYPKYGRYYKSLNMNIKRADISRYLILLKYGGLYMDLDIALKGPKISENATRTAVPQFISYKSKEFQERGISFAGNAFFAAVPDSPILRDVIEYAMNYKEQNISSNHGVLCHTGPIALGEVVDKYLKGNISANGQIISSSNIKIGAKDPKMISQFGGMASSASRAPISPLDYSDNDNYRTYRHNSHTIIVLNYTQVGNVDDHPKYAVHLRKHRW